MTIKEYKLKNGEKRYMFQVYVGVDPLTGKEQRTTRRGFKTKKQAELALARIKLQIENGTFNKETVETFKDVYDLWIEQYKHTVEESTFRTTKSYFENNILPDLGKYKITKITVEYCQKIVNKWFENYAKYFVFKSYASMVFKFAIKRGFIQDNPMALVDMPRNKTEIEEDEEEESQSDGMFYDKEELIHFLECSKKENHFMKYTAFRLLAFSGMRKGELLALTWEDINFKEKTIRINKALARGLNNRLYIKAVKNRVSRIIEIDDKTLAILNEWRKIQKQVYFKLGHNTLQPKQLVFSNQQNDFIDPATTNVWIKQIQDKHKLKKVTTHSLRHSHCSLLFEAGATIKEVQDRLGHVNVNTTMNIYAHVTKKGRSAVAQKFAEYMNS